MSVSFAKRLFGPQKTIVWCPPPSRAFYLQRSLSLVNRRMEPLAGSVIRGDIALRVTVHHETQKYRLLFRINIARIGAHLKEFLPFDETGSSIYIYIYYGIYALSVKVFAVNANYYAFIILSGANFAFRNRKVLESRWLWSQIWYGCSTGRDCNDSSFPHGYLNYRKTQQVSIYSHLFHSAL